MHRLLCLTVQYSVNVRTCIVSRATPDKVQWAYFEVKIENHTQLQLLTAYLLGRV